MWLLISCVFVTKAFPFARCFPQALSLWLAGSPSVQGSDVSCVCMSPAIVLLLRQGWGCSILCGSCCQTCLIASLQSHVACLSLLDFQEQLFGFGFWCWRRPCFAVTRDDTEACKRRIWQLDQPGLHCLSSWPLLCRGSSLQLLLAFSSFLFFPFF